MKLAGEWHNNHHLYPQSARSGFLWYQLDLAWCYIYTLHFLGAVTHVNDAKNHFRKKYLNAERVSAAVREPAEVDEVV